MCASILHLVREGEPLFAEGKGRRLRVHPFPFELRSEREPTVDWETAEYRWVEPDAIVRMDAVPLLVEVWERVGGDER